MRLCSNSHWLEHTPPLFKRFCSLTIYDIYKFNLGLFMNNYTCNNLPDSFKDYFTQNRNIHNYPTRISSLYRLYNFKYNLARNTIRRQGPLIWNQINLKFRNTKSVYLRVRAFFHKTVRVCHIYCNFKIGFTCRITIIFGTLKDGSLLINTLFSIKHLI